MDEYPNLDKEQKIEEIKPPNIKLKDGSEWYFHPGTIPLPKEWIIEDIVVVSHVGAIRKGEGKRSFKITNITRKKQEARAFWVNPPDKDKNMNDYDVIKKRKGVISERHASESKLDKNNPDEWLNQNLKIKEVQGDDHIVVTDMSQDSSEWEWSELTKNNFKGWVEGQTVYISKSELKPIKYWMKNLDMPDIQAASVSFMGLAKSKF